MKTETTFNKEYKTNLSFKNKYRNSLLLFFFSFLSILIVIAIDIIFIHNHSVSELWEGGIFHKQYIYELIEEKKPTFDNLHLIQTALLCFSSLLFTYGIKLFYHSNKPQNFDYKIKENTIGLLEEGKMFIKIKKTIIFLIISCSITFVYLFLKNPKKFSELSLEDQPIEIISAYLYFFCSAIFIYLCFVLKQEVVQHYKAILAISILFALSFFVIGMEEISWFQRVLTIETPKIFEGNAQNEMNLHNFYSNEAENIFYFSSFVFLIVLPFVDDCTTFLKNKTAILFFIPSKFIVLISATFVAYNYDMWNIALSQLAFFTTLWILFHYSRHYMRQMQNGFIIIFVSLACLLTQTIFLVFGDNFVRSWDVTEYKELFIPLAYFLYSVELLINNKVVLASSKI